ncbi:Zn-dependent hydrolase [Corynebacterium uropygiale]|uniref:Zn-dependent hydrolase n=1 Tax=Corynebacterium uropygiale TaxID=1775911 RepID=A0A9X1QQT3_9CORY|nr:Zn-dependent hydrolase [Corynebacterium uropygiale]MCF4007066.1 Zn-dependent hydrolase [Corynebacterium uropygiale]
MFNEDLAAHYLDTFASLSLPDNQSTTKDSGVIRWGMSLLEREAHTFFQEEMRSLGLDLSVDAAGNSIATLPGSDPDCGALACGSHLDSVYRAGRYDGIAGVIAAMLAARHVVESEERWRHPLSCVVFACEESARFSQACLGSRLATGLTSRSDLRRLHDAQGISAEEAMKECGLCPEEVDEQRWRTEDWEAFLELHIEQGPRLDEEGVQAGVVEVISGSTRLRITLEGIASHSGGTPMELRHDALAGAAEILRAAEDYARDAAHPGTRVTCGVIDVEPGGLTTIPGRCSMSIDIRDTSAESQRAAREAIEDAVATAAARRGLSATITPLSHVDPEELALGPRQALRNACRDLGVSFIDLPSGASHDAQIMARLCPTGMLFIPSLNGGVSHSPDELSRVSDLVTGARVLHAALRRLDHGA